MNKSFGFAVQTRWKIKELGTRFNVPTDKIIYWPNGTDVEKFSAIIPKDEARKKLGLPEAAKSGAEDFKKIVKIYQERKESEARRQKTDGK